MAASEPTAALSTSGSVLIVVCTDPFSDPVPAPAPKPMLEAVRDVVTVKSDSQRGKFSRSQTAATPYVLWRACRPRSLFDCVDARSGGAPSSRRRTTSDESLTKPLEKSKSTPGKASSKSKKGGLHVDVIDKLDISGIGAIGASRDT